MLMRSHPKSSVSLSSQIAAQSQSKACDTFFYLFIYFFPEIGYFNSVVLKVQCECLVIPFSLPSFTADPTGGHKLAHYSGAL